MREERFAAHTLQLAIQAALDVASHIVSDLRLGEPTTNRELFERLRTGGWLSPELTETMYEMAGFRNISAVLYLLLRTAAGRELEERILAPNETLHAPHLLDLESIQVRCGEHKR